MIQQNPSNQNGHGGKGELSLDMTVPADRAMLTRAISEGWAPDSDHMGEAWQSLHKALVFANATMDTREIRGIVDTMAKLVGQVQSDQQLRLKLAHGSKDSQLSEIHIRDDAGSEAY